MEIERERKFGVNLERVKGESVVGGGSCDPIKHRAYGPPACPFLNRMQLIERPKAQRLSVQAPAAINVTLPLSIRVTGQSPRQSYCRHPANRPSTAQRD